MASPSFDILVVGDADRAEFRPARQTLEALGRVTAVAEAAAAEAWLETTAAEVVVLAQAYPGQFSHEAVDRLRRRAPLARLVALLGSWCEGEMRSGRPWPAVPRLYWHQWTTRGEQPLRRLIEGRGSVWALPLTATDEERLLAATERPLPRGQGLVALVTRRPEMESWLADACAACGYWTVWLRPPQLAKVRGAVVAIYDGSDAGETELAQQRHLVASLAPAPVVVLLDFPRIEDRQRALAAGAAAVLSKPLCIEELARVLHQFAGCIESQNAKPRS